MSFKKTIAASLAAFGLAVVGSASAQEGYGALHYFGWTIDQDQLSEIESAGVRASGGYMFADYGLFDLGVEAHIASGGSDTLDYPVDATTEEAEVELNKVLGLFARANLPVTSRVNVFGLFGYSHGRADILAETTTDKISESGFGWGAGAEVALLPERLYLSFDHIEYFNQPGIDATATSVGLRLSFSGN